MNRRWLTVVATLLAIGASFPADGLAQGVDAGRSHSPRTATAVDLPAARGGPLAPVRHRLSRLERRVGGYQRTMARMERWLACIHHVRVDQVGDDQHRWGYEYDERDGTGLDARTALARRTSPGRPDLLLLRVARSRGCLSRAPDPNGTGADARGGGRRIGALERRLHRLDRRVRRVESRAERFDQWESCLSWLPVTEYGHEDQGLGYLVDDSADGRGQPDRYLPAIDIDTSEWDDPDYEVLAFLGRDRPFRRRECGHEPGEATDRHRSAPPDLRGGRLRDLRRDLRATAEDVEDLVEPVQEFVQFDECMFTVGVRGRSGYRFRTRGGTQIHRSALSFDLSGPRLPAFDVMAFPGEEPPQIECNEDAGGQDTDE